MRKCVQKWERKRAMALLSHVVGVLAHTEYGILGELNAHPKLLGAGSYNAVFALSNDLVLRVEKVPDEDIQGWATFKMCQLHPHPGLPVIWEIGTAECGRRWAIVERLDVEWAAMPGHESSGVPWKLISGACEHLECCGVTLTDNHGWNVMRRRKSDVWVISDPM